jgi:predicted DNA-binding protein
MPTQMVIRIDKGLKDALARLARQEGKTSSQLVREMIEEYIKERDISAYIDDLWERIGAGVKAKGMKPGDVKRAVKEVRAGKR